MGLYSLPILLFFFSLNSFAQVGIGNTNPSSASLLDIGDGTHGNTKGILIPRVRLTDLNTASPIDPAIEAEESLLVYNTNETIGKGFYYWNGGTRWIRIMASDAPIDKWSLTGNEATNSSFLGTTNNQALRIGTNNIERMRVLADGRVAVNSTVSFTSSFNSIATGSMMAIATEAEDNRAINAQTTGTGDAVFGIATGSGHGVVGIAQEGIGVTASSYNVDEMGLLVSGNNVSGVLGGPIGLGASLSGSSYGAGGFGRSTDGIGVIGIGNNNLTIISPPGGAGIVANGSKTGIYASASDSGTGSTNSGNAAGEFNLGTNPEGGPNTIRARAKIAGYHRGAVPSEGGTIGGTSTNNYYGGYFAGGEYGFFTNIPPPSYAYVGIKYNSNQWGENGTNYKIIGNGTVSTLVDDSAGNKRVLFAPEAPEILFEDYGVGKLQNGSVYINIDPLFAKSIHVSEKHPLKVFIQLEGECNGVFVTEKTASGFLVKELNGGTSNTPFSYHIVANRADDIASDGSIASKHVGLRFPIGPGPAEMMETRVVKVKEDKVKSEKAKDKTAASTESDIQAVEKHSSSRPQLLQEQQPTDTPVKSSNNKEMQLQKSK